MSIYEVFHVAVLLLFSAKPVKCDTCCILTFHFGRKLSQAKMYVSKENTSEF